jgi:hypothetical protein
VKVFSFFPCLVTEEDNAELYEEINLEEISGGLSSFQKGKSLGSDGWTMEFFIVFFYLSW